MTNENNEDRVAWYDDSHPRGHDTSFAGLKDEVGRLASWSQVLNLKPPAKNPRTGQTGPGSAIMTSCPT